MSRKVWIWFWLAVATMAISGCLQIYAGINQLAECAPPGFLFGCTHYGGED